VLVVGFRVVMVVMVMVSEGGSIDTMPICWVGSGELANFELLTLLELLFLSGYGSKCGGCKLDAQVMLIWGAVNTYSK
jgi:hypothetical protein